MSAEGKAERAAGRPLRGTPMVRWAEQAGSRALWAIGVMLVIAYGIVGVLTASAWQNEIYALQIVGLLAVFIGFAVMVWGFWGGIGAAAGAVAVALAVTVLAGRWSLRTDLPFERMPFVLEAGLFCVTAYLCVRFIEREEVEETADRRQLDRLEGEYLDLAVKYGSRESLLKMLRKKAGKFERLEVMAARLKEEPGGAAGAIQACLTEIVVTLEKGEGEVALREGAVTVRHSRGGEPVELGGGVDEIDRWLEAHQTALLVNNLTHDMRFTTEFSRSRAVVSVMAVPLVWGDDLKGTLRVTSVVPQAFSHDDLRYVSAAAEILVPVLFGEGSRAGG